MHRKWNQFLMMSWFNFWGVMLHTSGCYCMDLVSLSTEHDIHRPCITIGDVIIVQLQPIFLIIILHSHIISMHRKSINLLLVSWSTCWGITVLTTGCRCIYIARLTYSSTEHDIHRPCITIECVIIVQLQPKFLIMVLVISSQFTEN